MIESLINAILVKEGVRPAMLVQPIDYDETTGEDPITKGILDAIRHHFPELKHSDSSIELPGILIAPIRIDIHSIAADESMGKILGYPCYEDFSTLDRENEITYVLKVDVTLPDGTTHNIFVNVCKDESKLMEFAAIARRAELVLNNPIYSPLLGEGKKIARVKSSPNIPTKVLIEKIMANEELTPHDTNAISSIFFNLEFSKEFHTNCMSFFQMENPIHRGILLSLLLNDRNSLISPFYPLQLHPKEYEEVIAINKRWEKGVRHILKATEIVEYGGKKKANMPRKRHTRKRKH